MEHPAGDNAMAQSNDIPPSGWRTQLDALTSQRSIGECILIVCGVFLKTDRHKYFMSLRLPYPTHPVPALLKCIGKTTNFVVHNVGNHICTK